MPRPPDLSWFKVDGRLIEASSWEPWFKQAAKSRRAFANFINVDPLTNETASCGLLSSAASTAGLLSMTEYVCVKKHKTDYRRRANGRADLWVADPKRELSWAFEAKQVRCVPGTRVATLEDALGHACHDASRLTDLEADRLYGLLIATLPEAETEDLEPLMDRLDEFADGVDIACKFGGGARPAYVFFCAAQRDKTR